MKREEQIMNDPNLSAYTDKQRGWINEAFLDGVRWADETVIQKACEWLKENIDLYSYNAFNTKSCYTEITLTDEFETAFRQAMKGE